MLSFDYTQPIITAQKYYEKFMTGAESWVHAKLGVGTSIQGEKSPLPPQWVRSNIKTLVGSFATSCIMSAMLSDGSRLGAGLKGGLYGVVGAALYAAATRAVWIRPETNKAPPPLPGDLVGIAFAVTAAFAFFNGSRVDLMSLVATAPSYLAQRVNPGFAPVFVLCCRR